MSMSHSVASVSHTESAIRLRARFQIRSTCRFWWSCQSGDLNFGSGTTRNVSSGGVCITASGVPTVGAAVLVEIDLAWEAGSSLESAGERVLRVEGRVIRHETQTQEDQQIVFAVMATQATIESSPLASEGLVYEDHYA